MMRVPDAIWTALAGLLMLVGLAGVVLPVLPGLGLVWLAALGYGLLVGWGSSGPWLFALITVLGAGGLAAEMWMTAAGAKVGKASLWALVVGAGLAIVGLVVFNVLGAAVGLVVGVLVYEYLRAQDWRQAANAAAGTAAGCGLSFGVKLALGLAMIAAWVAWIVIG
jgi:uncharacterized protein YqgC (DUF456 family)